jgi:ketosteroid isomerase-like protein
MSQTDIENICARYLAVSRGDRGAVFRDVGPGFTLKTPDRVPNAGTYLGGEEANRFMVDFWAPFEEVKVEPQEFLENGDRIAVRLRVRSRHRGSSAFVEIHVGVVWTMRDGKPIMCEMFPEQEKAIEAAGLAPKAGSASS